MEELVFLKLGGSIITNKTRFEALVLLVLSTQVAEFGSIRLPLTRERPERQRPVPKQHYPWRR